MFDDIPESYNDLPVCSWRKKEYFKKLFHWLVQHILKMDKKIPAKES